MNIYVFYRCANAGKSYKICIRKSNWRLLEHKIVQNVLCNNAKCIKYGSDVFSSLSGLTTLWTDSVDDTLTICFLFCLENGISHLMEIVSVMERQNLFSGKNKSKYFSMSSTENFKLSVNNQPRTVTIPKHACTE